MGWETISGERILIECLRASVDGFWLFSFCEEPFNAFNEHREVFVFADCGFVCELRLFCYRTNTLVIQATFHFAAVRTQFSCQCPELCLQMPEFHQRVFCGWHVMWMFEGMWCHAFRVWWRE